MPNHPFVANLTSSIATVLNIQASRIQNVVASQATDGNTLVSFLVLPASANARRGSDLTSTEIVAMLQVAIVEPINCYSLQSHTIEPPKWIVIEDVAYAI